MRAIQIAALAELNKGARISSHWTNGSGRYTTSRAIPPFAERIERAELRSRKLPARITKVFEKYPKAQAVIAITNMRAARKALRAWRIAACHVTFKIL